MDTPVIEASAVASALERLRAVHPHVHRITNSSAAPVIDVLHAQSPEGIAAPVPGMRMTQRREESSST